MIEEQGYIVVRADGAQWIVEVREGARYHVVDRWSPDEGRIYEIGRHLMSLSGEKLGAIY